MVELSGIFNEELESWKKNILKASVKSWAMSVKWSSSKELKRGSRVVFSTKKELKLSKNDNY